jgi:hypothetical protein
LARIGFAAPFDAAMGAVQRAIQITAPAAKRDSEKSPKVNNMFIKIPTTV